MCRVEKRGKTVTKPCVVQDYNINMDRVDKSDGLMNMYKIARKKPKKYYHKIFRHLIDMAMLNAYALYKKKNGKLTRKEFIVTLGHQSHHALLVSQRNTFLTSFPPQERSLQGEVESSAAREELARKRDIGVLTVEWGYVQASYEKHHAFLIWLTFYSPCVVGMLWDVTDLECDLVTMSLIDNWLGPHVDDSESRKANKEKVEKDSSEKPLMLASKKKLLEALVTARFAAKQFMTSAALVTYGVPVQTFYSSES
ncbi:hypothetical protein J437_LFUL009966 [Ladona fulva]|uniref:PiggyBac transposable element-derived protein domain-containing protein n=1 Tax=Ladona fulva TaxID=123851 RepID=A0A8K0KF84_LADFU|nr:hypothetical protein J437_LFUL009966 [Ladona fulva]